MRFFFQFQVEKFIRLTSDDVSLLIGLTSIAYGTSLYFLYGIFNAFWESMS